MQVEKPRPLAEPQAEGKTEASVSSKHTTCLLRVIYVDNDVRLTLAPASKALCLCVVALSSSAMPLPFLLMPGGGGRVATPRMLSTQCSRALSRRFILSVGPVPLSKSECGLLATAPGENKRRCALRFFCCEACNV